MIVRILGEGQLEVDDSAADELNVLDAKLAAAVDKGDEAGYRTAHNALLERVRSIGRPVGAEVLEPSALILPQADLTMDEVRKLLTDEGLIPG
jgi:hypothetical protein